MGASFRPTTRTRPCAFLSGGTRRRQGDLQVCHADRTLSRPGKLDDRDVKQLPHGSRVHEAFSPAKLARNIDDNGNAAWVDLEAPRLSRKQASSKRLSAAPSPQTADERSCRQCRPPRMTFAVASPSNAALAVGREKVLRNATHLITGGRPRRKPEGLQADPAHLPREQSRASRRRGPWRRHRLPVRK